MLSVTRWIESLRHTQWMEMDTPHVRTTFCKGTQSSALISRTRGIRDSSGDIRALQGRVATQGLHCQVRDNRSNWNQAAAASAAAIASVQSWSGRVPALRRSIKRITIATVGASNAASSARRNSPSERTSATRIRKSSLDAATAGCVTMRSTIRPSGSSASG